MRRLVSVHVLPRPALIGGAAAADRALAVDPTVRTARVFVATRARRRGGP